MDQEYTTPEECEKIAYELMKEFKKGLQNHPPEYMFGYMEGIVETILYNNEKAVVLVRAHIEALKDRNK